MAGDRYYYFRAHKHPFGWGVGDSKTGACVAMADKNTCCELAKQYNRDAFGHAWDVYYSHPNSDFVYRYNHNTGALEPFHLAGRALPEEPIDRDWFR